MKFVIPLQEMEECIASVIEESVVGVIDMGQSSSAPPAEKSFEDLYSDTVELEQALSARTRTLREKLIEIATAQVDIAQRSTEFAQARDDLGDLQQQLVEAQENVIACNVAYQNALEVHHERTGEAVAANIEVRKTREQLFKATARFQTTAKEKAAQIYNMFH